MELQQLLQLAVLPTGIYIYINFENFGIVFECLVYKFLIWYIFGRFSLVGLVKIVNQRRIYAKWRPWKNLNLRPF